MNIFILSLKESKSRRDSIIQIMNKFNIDFRFFDAIDGKKFDQNFINRYNLSISDHGLEKFCGQLNNGEFGCAISHIEIARTIVKDNYPFAIILEDDISISDSFMEFLKNTNFKEIKSEILLLGFHRALGTFNRNSHIKFLKTNITSGLKYGVPICCYYGTYAYLISNEGAKKIIEIHEKYNLILKADNFINYSWFKGLDLRILQKPIVFPSVIAEQSTINNFSENLEANSNYKPKIIKGKGNIKILLGLNLLLFRLGIRKPMFINNNKLMTRNFDEFNGVFYDF